MAQRCWTPSKLVTLNQGLRFPSSSLFYFASSCFSQLLTMSRVCYVLITPSWRPHLGSRWAPAVGRVVIEFKSLRLAHTTARHSLPGFAMHCCICVAKDGAACILHIPWEYVSCQFPQLQEMFNVSHRRQSWSTLYIKGITSKHLLPLEVSCKHITWWLLYGLQFISTGSWNWDPPLPSEYCQSCWLGVH